MFPQHCILPQFTPTQHAERVGEELVESIQAFPRAKKKKWLSKIAKAIRDIDAARPPPLPRVVAPTSEGKCPISDGGYIHQQPSPAVTTTNDPTDPQVLRKTPRTHLRKMHANTPGILPYINIILPAPQRTKRHNPHMVEIEPIAMMLDSKRIPMVRGNIISQEAVNFVTAAVYGETGTAWLPQEFVFASTGNDVTNNDSTYEIEHFCAPVIHPVTGETITQYRKLQQDRDSHPHV